MQIKDAADTARNNDTAGLKRDVPFFLTDDGSAPLNALKYNQLASTKNDRGFLHNVMGRFLCPVSLDWDDMEYRSFLFFYL